jgi:hypothetical protein
LSKAAPTPVKEKQHIAGGKIMNRLISLALLVGGVVLMVMGITAMDAFSSDISRFFTGAPTDKSVWLLIGGIVAALMGISGVTFFRSSKA